MKLAALVMTMTAVVMSAAETKLDGHKVFYEVSGSGSPAIVLVHGWTCDSTFFAPQMAGLTKAHKVVVIDLPGHGKSDKPEVRYDGKLFGRAVLAAMDAARVEKAVLVGHSMGLPVIRNAYELAPARVLGLVSIDGAVTTESRAGSAKGLTGEQGLARRREMIQTMFSPITTDAVKAHVMEVMAGTPEHVAIGAMSDGIGTPLWNTPVSVPALAIQRTRPTMAPMRKSFASAMTNLDFREMDGVGHFLMMEKPAEVNAIILEWMAGLK